MGKLPNTSLLRLRGRAVSYSCPSTTTHTRTRPTAIPSSHFLQPSSPCSTTQVRHATYVMRSRRPYQFTQLVQLSDGSTFTMRTTSPASLYKSAKDTRNHILWQPTEKSLRNVELDEAGKLAAFRERFGRGWDLGGKPDGGQAAAAVETAAGAAGGKKDNKAKVAELTPAEPAEDPFDSLADLISGYASQDTKKLGGGLTAKEQAKREKKKK